MQSEADVRGAFNRAIHANQLLGQAIESPLTGIGIPDEYLRTTKKSGWVEFKYSRFEPTFPYSVTFEDGQFPWLTQHWKLGGTSVLAIWFPSGLYCWANARIQRYYDSVVDCDLHMTSISGKRFVEWFDNL